MTTHDTDFAAILHEMLPKSHADSLQPIQRQPGQEEALERAIEVLSRSTKHFVEVTGNAWAIEHPLPCRDLGSLLLCPLHTAVEKDFKTHRGWPSGRYFVMLDPFGDLWIESQT